jgi:DNA-binding CsgD family transcriptional regulator
MWRLTSREQEILLLIGQAVRGRKIARTLGISEYTVRKHRASIMRKLGLQSAAQLISHAVMVSVGFGAFDDDGRSPPATASLHPREMQVLGLLVAGRTSKEIARQLAISPLTVRKHRQNMMRKRAVHSLAELIETAQPEVDGTPSEVYRTRFD